MSFKYGDEHGWLQLTGFASPWEITEDAMLTRSFFEAFWYAIVEKNLQGSEAYVDYYDMELTANRWNMPVRTDAESFYEQIIGKYVELWNDGDWIRHDMYTPETFNGWWIYTKDTAFYTDEDLKEYIGVDMFEFLFEGGVGNTAMWGKEDPMVWRALGIIYWFCQYKYVNLRYNRGGFAYDTPVTPPTYTGLPAFSANIPPFPRLGDKFIAREDATYDQIYYDNITGEEKTITHTWTKGNLYEWVDDTPPSRKAGERVTRSWFERPIEVGDTIGNLGVSAIIFEAEVPDGLTDNNLSDGKGWERTDGTPNPQLMSAFPTYYDWSGGNNSGYWKGARNTDNKGRDDQYGPQSMNEAVSLATGGMLGPQVDPTSAIGVTSGIHNEGYSALEYKSSSYYSRNGDETVGLTVSQELDIDGGMTNGHVRLYATDIEGTPLLGDALFSTSIKRNFVRVWNTTYTPVGGYTTDEDFYDPLYEAFPRVTEDDDEILLQLPLIPRLDDNGFTHIEVSIEGQDDTFGEDNIVDWVYPLVPPDPVPPTAGDEEATFRNRTEGKFWVAISNTKPKYTPDPDFLDKPLFVNTMLPESKYFASGVPEKIEEEED